MMLYRGTQEEENALYVLRSYKMRENAVAVCHCSARPRLMVSIPCVNGRYLCQSVMHYLRVSTLETEAQRWWGCIDCDRPEETCTPLLKCLGLLSVPPQINFYCSGFGDSAVSSLSGKSSLAEIACGSPTVGLNAINRSFITSP